MDGLQLLADLPLLPTTIIIILRPTTRPPRASD
jgi:hypothetical protein